VWRVEEWAGSGSPWVEEAMPTTTTTRRAFSNNFPDPPFQADLENQKPERGENPHGEVPIACNGLGRKRYEKRHGGWRMEDVGRRREMEGGGAMLFIFS